MNKNTKKVVAKAKTRTVKIAPAEPLHASFAEVVNLIEQARERAYQAVNTELVGLYWQIGQYISRKLETAEWGEGVVDHRAQHLALTLPGQRGFTRRNLFRMRQFYETYRGDGIVSPLVTQFSRSHSPALIAEYQTQLPEKKLLAAKLHEFYLLNAPDRPGANRRGGRRK